MGTAAPFDTVNINNAEASNTTTKTLTTTLRCPIACAPTLTLLDAQTSQEQSCNTHFDCPISRCLLDWRIGQCHPYTKKCYYDNVAFEQKWQDFYTITTSPNVLEFRYPGAADFHHKNFSMIDASLQYQAQQERIAQTLTTSQCGPDSAFTGYLCGEYPFISNVTILNLQGDENDNNNNMTTQNIVLQQEQQQQQRPQLINNIYYLQSGDVLNIGVHYVGKANRVTVSLKILTTGATNDTTSNTHAIELTTVELEESSSTSPKLQTIGVTIPNTLPTMTDTPRIVLELHLHAINSLYSERQKVFYPITLTPDNSGQISTKNDAMGIAYPIIAVPSCMTLNTVTGELTQNCNNNGTCDITTGKCQCTNSAYTAESRCSRTACQDLVGCVADHTERCELPTFAANTTTHVGEMASGKCHCKPLYEGDKCQTPSPNTPCTVQDRCQNGGSAESCGSTKCVCRGNFQGSRCQTCGLRCLNGGVASPGCDACICPTGYAGDSCQCRAQQATLMMAVPEAWATIEDFFINNQTAIIPCGNATHDGVPSSSPGLIYHNGMSSTAWTGLSGDLLYATMIAKRDAAIIASSVLQQDMSSSLQLNNQILSTYSDIQIHSAVDWLQNFSQLITFHMLSDLVVVRRDVKIHLTSLTRDAGLDNLRATLVLSNCPSASAMEMLLARSGDGEGQEYDENNVTSTRQQQDMTLLMMDLQALDDDYTKTTETYNAFHDKLQNTATNGFFSYVERMDLYANDVQFISLSPLSPYQQLPVEDVQQEEKNNNTATIYTANVSTLFLIAAILATCMW